VALIGEFTVKGAVKYFGWIFGMKNEEIEEQFQFLSNLLELPPKDRYIKNLRFKHITCIKNGVSMGKIITAYLLPQEVGYGSSVTVYIMPILYFARS
jgi:ABC-type Na+ transport system ATPase subunit NatA